MTEKRKYTAHLNRKGLDATGVTEDHARHMAGNLGGTTMLIVEARTDTMTTDSEGNVSVALAATNMEPVPGSLDERVREFQRALYRQRPEVMGQEVLQGTDSGPALGAAADALNPEVWDGDTDAPPAPPEAECPAPECTLAEDHDGDHAAPEAGGSIHTPDFSGRKKA